MAAAFGHGVQRLPDGRLRVRLSRREHDMLASLPEQLRDVLSGAHDPAGARARLFPAAYDDAQAEAEYRDMVGEALVAERLDAVDTFAHTLKQGHAGRLTWTAELSREQADAWLSALNDTRLALAEAVGITDESDWEGDAAPPSPARTALLYLGWLQEELLAALLANLPDA